MKNDHVSNIKTTQEQWIGTFDTSRTGEWMDYAMHLVGSQLIRNDFWLFFLVCLIGVDIA